MFVSAENNQCNKFMPEIEMYILLNGHFNFNIHSGSGVSQKSAQAI